MASEREPQPFSQHAAAQKLPQLVNFYLENIKRNFSLNDEINEGFLGAYLWDW